MIVAWLVITLTFGLMAAGLVWVGQRRRVPEVRRRRTLVALCLPFALVCWLVILLLGALGLEDLTGIKLTFDARQSWDVPLPNRYKLQFEQVPTTATLIRPNREPMLAGVTRVAVEGGRVSGISELGAFVLDTQTGQLTKDVASPEALEAVADYQNGFARYVRTAVWTVLLVLFPWILAWRFWN